MKATNSTSATTYSTKRQWPKLLLVIVVASLLAGGCTTLKPYERVYVNDPEMRFGSDAGQSFDGYVRSIRTGAVPAGGSKSSGGCGCN
jgi:hypothetical protein